MPVFDHSKNDLREHSRYIILAMTGDHISRVTYQSQYKL